MAEVVSERLSRRPLDHSYDRDSREITVVVHWDGSRARGAVRHRGAGKRGRARGAHARTAVPGGPRRGVGRERVHERADSESKSKSESSGRSGRGAQTPPVDEGEVRQVTVESVGDQGDGIAKVERGYVVIVPDARPGDEPTVEIEEVQQNVAFARVIDGRGRPH